MTSMLNKYLDRQEEWRRFHEWEERQSEDAELPERISWFASAMRIALRLNPPVAADLDEKISLIRDTQRKLSLLKRP